MRGRLEQFERFFGGLGWFWQCWDTHLSFADGGIDDNGAIGGAHQGGRRSIIARVERVQRFKNRFQLILCPDIGMRVPRRGLARKDLLHDAGHNTKVVTRTFQGPEQILVALGVYPDLGAVGEDDVEVHEGVRDQAVETFVSPVAATETWTQQTDARGGSGSFIAAISVILSSPIQERSTYE